MSPVHSRLGGYVAIIGSGKSQIFDKGEFSKLIKIMEKSIDFFAYKLYNKINIVKWRIMGKSK